LDFFPFCVTFPIHLLSYATTQSLLLLLLLYLSERERERFTSERKNNRPTDSSTDDESIIT